MGFKVDLSIIPHGALGLLKDLGILPHSLSFGVFVASTSHLTREERIVLEDSNRALHLVLAEYCGISPESVARGWLYDGASDDFIRNVVTAAKRIQEDLFLDNPIVALYKQNTQARNQVHYYLSVNPLLGIKNAVPDVCSSATYRAVDRIFREKIEEMRELVQQRLEERIKRNGRSAILFRHSAFIEPEHAVHYLPALSRHLEKQLLASYTQGDANPWETAVPLAVEGCFKEMRIVPASELTASELEQAVTHGLNYNNRRRHEIKQQLIATLKEHDMSIDKYVQGIIKQTTIDAERRETRKTPYGRLLLDMIGSVRDRVLDTYADIALAYEEQEEKITCPEQIEERLVQALQHRTDQGWFRVTPEKRQYIDERLAYIRRTKNDEMLCFALHYGLEDNMPLTKEDIELRTSLRPSTIDKALWHTKHIFFSGLFAELVRDGATDSDLAAYRACVQ
jgi:hypothetical protein